MRSRALLGGFGVFQGVVEGLAYVGCAGDYAPAVIVEAEGGVGSVARVAGIKCGSYFVERLPVPGELNCGEVALFGDSAYCYQFSFSGRNCEQLLFGIVGRHNAL